MKGSTVIVYLREPRERMWGILHSIDVTGLYMQGLDVNSFDQWLSDIPKEEPFTLTLSKLFFPMHRVEKVLVDESTGSIPSLSEKFEARMGKKLSDFFPSFEQ
ncbi:MAG: hypothetical protein AB1756_10550 [Acidobacteriota bacterium]